MEEMTLSRLCSTVYQRFPDTSGSKPTVKRQTADLYLLIFKCYAKIADGKSLPKIYRVVADDRGKILKVSSSR